VWCVVCVCVCVCVSHVCVVCVVCVNWRCVWLVNGARHPHFFRGPNRLFLSWSRAAGAQLDSMILEQDDCGQLHEWFADTSASLPPPPLCPN
jgi:hypothetical protein